MYINLSVIVLSLKIPAIFYWIVDLKNAFDCQTYPPAPPIHINIKHLTQQQQVQKFIFISYDEILAELT